MAASEDTRDSESPFGVLEFLAWSHEWNGYHYRDTQQLTQAADLMKEAGVGFVRMDFLRSDIESGQGGYTFDKYDRIVRILEEKNIKILGLLGYNASREDQKWNAAPDEAGYVQYAKAVVEHFRGSVKYWEIWNEPDSADYWQPQDGLKRYAQLLKRVYPELKKTDPTCKIVLGGLSQYWSIHLRYLYKADAGGSFDIVNIHPFVDPLLADPILVLEGNCRAVQKVMRDNGDISKPIWLTEIGCPGTSKAGVKNWWAGRNPSEDEQAQWVQKIYAHRGRYPGVQKIFWAFFRDTRGHFDSGVDYFGLVRADFSKKPAFDSYQRATQNAQAFDNP